jgi:hypothetical protein
MDSLRLLLLIAIVAAAFMLGRTGAACVKTGPKGKQTLGPPKGRLLWVLPSPSAGKVWYGVFALALLIELWKIRSAY